MADLSKVKIFFKKHVLPSYNDWTLGQLAEHKAMALAINLYHMADYFWESFSSQPAKVYLKSNIGDFKCALALNSVDYALIRDVCDAHKHCSLNRNSRILTRSDQTGSGSIGWDEAKWDDGEWDKPEEIVIIDDYNKKHHFKAVVERMFLFWQDQIS